MHLTLSPARTTRKASAAAHARSASEPTHPALARLDVAVRALRAWSFCCCGGSGGSSSSSGYGLALLEAVLAALGELLATPRPAAALHDADHVLDAFLELADAYGTFGAALLAAKQSVADAEAGARRGDAAAVAAAARAHRRTEKELRHLAAAMRHASRHAAAAVPTTSAADATGTTAEVVIRVVAEATVAAAEASAAIFSRCAAMSPDVSAMVQRVSSHKWLARLGVAPVATKVAPEMGSAALERLEELEECLAGLESESEKVFRMLLQARVLLPNIHNPL
ncbi:hypothetical protein HU200_049727 [Digitaria exilis]|uniref:Uncharacterized protein n=1 Tax=Digitaria exilis TaxID=1010633 RepID=A0A835AVM2_9POAL|nr:hypothetical protein HU200_049727 [Digitaria exilis]CAB3494217.1 unnamed protein product [Digitaria exilis]